MSKLLKFVSLLTAFVIGTTTFLNTASAMYTMPENNTKNNILNQIEDGTYTTEDGTFTIERSTFNNILTVKVTDHRNKIKSVVTRNLVTGEIISDGKKVNINTFQFRTGNRINFNITANSVANLIALLAVTAELVAAVATSGLTWSGFIKRAEILARALAIAKEQIGNESIVNGYFEFEQETRIHNGTPQARNYNRKLAIREGNGEYVTHKFEDGDWFYTSNPY